MRCNQVFPRSLLLEHHEHGHAACLSRVREWPIFTMLVSSPSKNSSSFLILHKMQLSEMDSFVIPADLCRGQYQLLLFEASSSLNSAFWSFPFMLKNKKKNSEKTKKSTYHDAQAYRLLSCQQPGLGDNWVHGTGTYSSSSRFATPSSSLLMVSSLNWVAVWPAKPPKSSSSFLGARLRFFDGVSFSSFSSSSLLMSIIFLVDLREPGVFFVPLAARDGVAGLPEPPDPAADSLRSF